MQMGYPGYFLVTADLLNYARSVNLRVGPGRGSAAGSLVAYVLGITDLDPIHHKLIFERFLNPERVSMPDIDMDFDERRRGEMIRYVTEKYGEEKIAQIITYSTIKAKAAIKDSARVLFGQPGYAVADRITKSMPPAVMGKDIPLSGVFDPSHKRYSEAAEMRALYESDAQVKEIVDTAKDLEGLKRQWGVHAAGVIMSKEPLIDVIPIQRREADGAIITQFDMGVCETLGLLKMDFLGLRNLTIIDDALNNITLNGKEALDLDNLGLDDKATYELLSRGETLGVFQLDGGPMRDLLRRMAPTEFDDISAVGALYRPGPMGANAHNDYADRKNGRQEVTPIHPELAEPLKEVLGETYGLIVYQEQVMAIAQVLAGYSLGKADLLRRAMGKKKKEILDKEYEGFAQGMKDNGYSAAAIKTLWDILLPFSDYAFNRAHSAAYGVVSYWTAYLKANYPAEYMAAVLTSVRDDKDKAAIYLAECRKMGITVLPPDVNESVLNFAPVGTDIRFGLGAIRNVGTNVVDAIVTSRREKGPFTDFSDFLRKVPQQVCNKKTVESLIKAGAFDSLGHPRKGLALVHAEAVDAVMTTKKAEADGQFDLFGSFDEAGRGRRRRHHGHVRRQGARGRVGAQAPPRARAGDARSLRVGAPAQRPRAGPRQPGRHRDHEDPRGRRRRGRDGHGRRHPRHRHPAGEQEGRALGVGADRGSRRRHRGAVLPAHLRRGVDRRRRGRDRAGQGQGQQAGRPRQPVRGGPRGARSLRWGRRRAGQGRPRERALHPGAGRQAQGGPRRPPGPERGAPDADGRQRGEPCAASRRRAEGPELRRPHG